MQKVCVYIDGFNFYNGLRDNDWRHYYWLDIIKMANNILAELHSEHKLVRVYYFSAPPYRHESKRRRQKIFFDANVLGKDFKLILGYHKDKSKRCRNCNAKISISEEKQTDINIVLEMFKGAVKKECDLSILVSGDTDMIPVVQAIKSVSPNHKIMVFFPPARKTNQIIGHVDGWRDLSKFEKIFSDSLLPEKIELENKSKLIIPDKWLKYKEDKGIDEASLSH